MLAACVPVCAAGWTPGPPPGPPHPWPWGPFLMPAAQANVISVDGRRAAHEGKTMSAPNRIAVASALLAVQVAPAFADDPPKLDVTTSCSAASVSAISAGRDKEACLQDERSAENTIAQNWSKYNADHKSQCIGTVKTGGPASYVELLSCLEVMRDAKESHDGEVRPSDSLLQSTRRHRR
jgi:hypothetical protein